MEKYVKIQLPYFFKFLGFAIVLIAIILAVVRIADGNDKISDFVKHNANIFVSAFYAMMIFGLFLIVFSKEKFEDELINHIRIKSFQLTVALHSLFFLIFSFTNLTLNLINFPAIILMVLILLVYTISFYIQKTIIFKNSSQ